MDPSRNEEKCTCDKSEPSQESDSSTSESSPRLKDKKLKIPLPSLNWNLRRGKSKRSRKSSNPDTSIASGSSKELSLKKSPKWSLKFNCTKRDSKDSSSLIQKPEDCKCTCYRKTEEIEDRIMGLKLNGEQSSESEGAVALVGGETTPQNDSNVDDGNNQSDAQELDSQRGLYGINHSNCIILNGSWDVRLIQPLAHEDCDEAARQMRAIEMEHGVEAPSNFKAMRKLQLTCGDESEGRPPRRWQLVCPNDVNVESIRALFHNNFTVQQLSTCHSQIDFIHCLVPDLFDITKCSFYWGKMDRYEAERLLDGKPEGTFLLRDSAQEEFLFSVSFRKYGRSLHARIEQWNHKFSFDSHDPGVFTSKTVCGLIEHYKDPSSCMFFEPMLTSPLHRNFTFSLQHLCRAVIANRLSYDNVNHLQLPKTLKSYLKEYHYRQKIRVETFDV